VRPFLLVTVGEVEVSMQREHCRLRAAAGSAGLQICRLADLQKDGSTCNSMVVCSSSRPWRRAIDAGRRRVHH